MPPAVSRMHPSHMSNPFQHLNPQHSIPQQQSGGGGGSQHYQSQSQSQSQHLPNSFNPGQHAFGGGLNGGISPFNPSGAYGGNAFSNMPALAPQHSMEVCWGGKADKVSRL